MDLPRPVVMDSEGDGLRAGRSLLGRLLLVGSALTPEGMLNLGWSASEFDRPVASLSAEPLIDFRGQHRYGKAQCPEKPARRVHFKEPDIIEVPSWKDETRQMYYRAQLEDDILEESVRLLLQSAKRLLSSRVALAAASAAAMTGMVAVGFVSTMQQF
ncbi:FOXRED1 [Symbiodinium pilosum]|uniref:FOXRED1 protein n=1 Tax=Symbiodinium pilosum TaxID=2952 RepID=A0A812TI14_SYMPI|nr:FOXRED1 [Symbiodinium pilosum]